MPEQSDRANGHVKPHDDPAILDDDGLLHRIDPNHHVIWDDNRQQYRVSSVAFTESSTKISPNGGMSVRLERPMQNDGVDPLDSLEKDWGLVRLEAGNMRRLNCMVGPEPLPEDPYHANVWNTPPKPGKKIKVRDRYTWVRKAKNIP